MKTLKETLLWAESGYGAKTAVVDLDSDIRWTYRELNDRARSVAAGLTAAGVRKGDRIGWIAMAPGAHLAALTMGAKKIGAIPTVMNARTSVDRFAWMVSNVDVSLLAYAPDCEELLARVQAAGVPDAITYLALGEPVEDDHLTVATFFETYPDAPEPDVEVLPDDPSHIIYTSGSSGPPKPVVFQEEQWIESQRNMAYGWSVYHEDCFPNFMPPHFAAWFSIQTVSVIAAATQMFVRFDPTVVNRAIRDEGCTQLIISPSMIRMLRQVWDTDPDSAPNPRVRVGMLGGEPITPDVLDSVDTMFPNLQLQGSLGSTESGGAILHTGLGNDRILHDEGTLVGRPMLGVTVELRDPETGAVVTEPGVAGEMFVKGPIASSIWGDEELTAKNFPDGWWRSGDLLIRDEEGYFSFAGRSDSIFKSGAIKVSTNEIEKVLKSHPDILDAVVVPVPDEIYGLVPYAFVRNNTDLDSSTMEAWWRDQNSAEAYARPRHWTFLGTQDFPMVTAAKIDRAGLKQQAVDDTATDAS